MGNSTVIPLQGEELLANQLELVVPTTVAGTLYGIAFTLFCLYVHKLAPRLRDGGRKRQAKFMLGFSTVIMLSGLYNLVSNAWVTQDAYIKHSSYPKGPWSFIASSDRTPVTVVAFTCQLAIDALTSAIQIWRVWVIWSATRHAIWAIALPALGFLAFTSIELWTLVNDASLPIAQAARLNEKIKMPPSIFQGAVTILCTVLISLYLIFQQWRQRKLIGKSQGSSGYMNVVTILIESYALESIWILMGGIIWGQVVSFWFIESEHYIVIIAYLLVQFRVTSETAYESQTGQRNISSLHWNHSNHGTTQFGETSEIHRGPHVPATQEASNV